MPSQLVVTQPLPAAWFRSFPTQPSNHPGLSPARVLDGLAVTQPIAFIAADQLALWTVEL